MRRETLVLDGRDNVAAALTDLQAAETVHVRVPGGHTLEILLRQAICLGHKFALRDDLDVDASPIITGEKEIQDLGVQIYAEMLSVAAGKRTKTEILGHFED